MKVRNINPLGAVELPGYGDVDAGAVIEVPDDGPAGSVFAGRPPAPRVAEAMAELAAAVEAIDHARAAALREELVGLDHGAGLLAQTTNWEPAVSKSTRAAASGEEAQP